MKDPIWFKQIPDLIWAKYLFRANIIWAKSLFRPNLKPGQNTNSKCHRKGETDWATKNSI
jgi:hypothetical protein